MVFDQIKAALMNMKTSFKNIKKSYWSCDTVENMLMKPKNFPMQSSNCKGSSVVTSIPFQSFLQNKMTNKLPDHLPHLLLVIQTDNPAPNSRYWLSQCCLCTLNLDKCFKMQKIAPITFKCFSPVSSSLLCNCMPLAEASPPDEWDIWMNHKDTHPFSLVSVGWSFWKAFRYN